MKKYGLIVGIVLIILIALGGGYFFFFGQNSTGEAPGFLSNFFGGESPDRSGEPPSESVRPGGNDLIDTGGAVFQSLRKITAASVAGAVTFSKGTDENLVRYVETETGHVFETSDSSTSIARITNTTVPRIEEALWSSDGEHVLLRYLGEDRDTVLTFLGEISDEDTSSEGALIGSFLPEDISEIATNATSIFYLLEGREGSEGVRTNFDNSAATRVFEHPLIEWDIEYTSSNRLAFATKSSSEVPGFLYLVNGTTGALSQLLGGINGLGARISPDESEVIYSENASNRIALNVANTVTSERRTLPIATLAEKCVWSIEEAHTVYCAVPKVTPRGNYPDLWYQGVASFSDEIWKINTETETLTLLADPIETAREEIDAIDLMLSPDESLLIFINKKDSSLWSLTLEQSAAAIDEEPL